MHLGKRVAQFQSLLQWTWHWEVDNESSFINIASSECSKIMCQSPKCWESRKYICVFGFFLFPFWVVASEGQVFKLYLMTMTRVSCVHKHFPSLYNNLLGGSFPSSFYFSSTFVPLSRQNKLLVKALPTPGQKNHLLPRILASRGGEDHTSLLLECWIQLTDLKRNNLEMSFTYLALFQTEMIARV